MCGLLAFFRVTRTTHACIFWIASGERGDYGDDACPRLDAETHDDEQSPVHRRGSVSPLHCGLAASHDRSPLYIDLTIIPGRRERKRDQAVTLDARRHRRPFSEELADELDPRCTP